MPQHTKITIKKVEDTLDEVESRGGMMGDLDRIAIEDLLRVLPEIDHFLVKHDRTPLARRLRRAFDKYRELG